MIIKCKPKDRVELEEVSKQACQTDYPSPFRIVVDIDIPSNLCSISEDVDIIELPRQHSICQADDRDANTEDDNHDEEEEFTDDVETESDEDRPQLSE